MRVTVGSWGPDCGPRPRSATVPAAGRVHITQSGDQLVIHGRVVRRSDSCWSENRAVRRVSSSRQSGRWRTVCRTPADDPRSETGTYTVRADGDGRLELKDQSHYDWQLNESHCVGSITSTQVFTRSAGVASPFPPPAEGHDRPACVPGAPARLRLRPRAGRIAPGEQLRLRATLLDANGCGVRGATIRWGLSKPAGRAGQLRGGVFRAGDTAAEAEGEFVVTARSGGMRAEARIVVRTPDLSDLIAQRTGGGVVQAEDMGDATLQSAAGVDAQPSERTLLEVWRWPALGILAALLLLAGAGLFLLRRRRPKIIGGIDDRWLADEAAAGSEGVQPSERVDAAGDTAGSMLCPLCQQRYDGREITFCARDGTRLQPVVGSPPAQGEPLICPVCRRGHAPGSERCATDGEALIPYAVFVERQKARQDGAGRVARVCPKCGHRYPREVAYCREDGSELVPVD